MTAASEGGGAVERRPPPFSLFLWPRDRSFELRVEREREEESYSILQKRGVQDGETCARTKLKTKNKNRINSNKKVAKIHCSYSIKCPQRSFVRESFVHSEFATLALKIQGQREEAIRLLMVTEMFLKYEDHF